jgi:hypothetical protein
MVIKDGRSDFVEVPLEGDKVGEEKGFEMHKVGRGMETERIWWG